MFHLVCLIATLAVPMAIKLCVHSFIYLLINFLGGGFLKVMYSE